MGTKNNPGEFDCYGLALPDEPVFVLLARDTSFYELVLTWADLRENEIDAGRRPEEDRAMVQEARNCAEDARLWREQNNGKWREGK